MSHVADVDSYIDGAWVPGSPSLVSVNPRTGEEIASAPRSDWADIDRAITSGVKAFRALHASDSSDTAGFLELFAAHLDANAERISRAAHLETGLPIESRLASTELPRTIDQLQQAAAAARDRTWVRPTIDTTSNVRSMLTPLSGPVVTFGPSNFPLAFSSIAGGDAAAAFATGHPVIAKAHPSHVRTSALLMECALDAADEAEMPQGWVQLVYDIEPEDGLRLVADRRIAATGFTGGRATGLALKRAADSAGVPVFLEMSSINPVVVLPDAARVDGANIVAQLVHSINLGVGQFCTKPGLVFMIEDRELLSALVVAVEGTDGGILGSSALCDAFNDTVERLTMAGAKLLARGRTVEGQASVEALLLSVSGAKFRQDPVSFQEEAFGPGALLVECSDFDELASCLGLLEGSLTGTVFATGDDHQFDSVLRMLEPKVGRLAVNKAPTGVQVVPAMNHGGPYPATGLPSFTSVGIPRALERFGKLTCYDGAPDGRLPKELQNANPLRLWRSVDGAFTTDPVS